MKTHDFILGPVDTDSISFCKQDGSLFSEEEQEQLLDEINELLPPLIKYAPDGYFNRVVICRAKNYILYDGKKIKTKGSALRNINREPALKEFIARIIDCLVFDKIDNIDSFYKEYIKEIYNMKDISRWTSRKTVTESVLNPERTNEQKVLDAIGDTHVQQGDKVYVYFKEDNSLGTQENWNNDHNREKLVEKVYKTLALFKLVLDMSKYNKYHLKRSKPLLEELLNGNGC